MLAEAGHGLRYKFRAGMWRLHGALRQSATIPTAQGVFTVSCADDVIGRSLYCSGQHELDLSLRAMEFVQRRASRPSGSLAVLDIGAHVGVISVGMVRRGLVGSAIAIEADPRNFRMLQENVRQNGLESSFLCLPYAVAEQAGTVRFELSETNFGDHRVRTNAMVSDLPERYGESSRRVIEVTAESLDNLMTRVPERFAENLGIIWIDVQGFEGQVFMGGKSVFAKDIPVVAEIWPYGIRRTGMSQERFCEIVSSLWSSYWVTRQGRFIRYPVAALGSLFDELGDHGAFDNVILTQ